MWPLINAINRDWTFEYHAGLVHSDEFEKKSIQIFEGISSKQNKLILKLGCLANLGGARLALDFTDQLHNAEMWEPPSNELGQLSAQQCHRDHLWC